MVFMTCCGGVCSAKVLTMVQNSNRRHLSMSKKKKHVQESSLLSLLKIWDLLLQLENDSVKKQSLDFQRGNIRTPAPQVACGCLQSEREKLIRLSHCAIRTWAQHQKDEFDNNLDKSKQQRPEWEDRGQATYLHMWRSAQDVHNWICNIDCFQRLKEVKKKTKQKKLFRFKFSTFSLILETFLELICHSKDTITLILVYVEAPFSGSLLKSRKANSVCTTPGEILCKQTFEKWVSVKWNTALYVTHVSGNCASVTQH